MNSLVIDVLTTTAAKMDTTSLKDKINDIRKEIVKLKSDVKIFIEDNYIDFLPTLKKDHILIEETERLVQEMQTLQLTIDNQIKVELSGSTRELKILSQALEASNTSLKLSKQLLELNDLLKLAEKLEKEKDYINAAEVLKKVKLLLNEPHDTLKLLNIYTPLRDKYHTTYGSLLTLILNLWEQRVCWNDYVVAWEQTTASLTIECDLSDIEQPIQALYYLDALSTCIHHFSNKLMKHIISPIIHLDCSVSVKNEKVFNIIVGDRKHAGTYKAVFHNLQMLFKFIEKRLNVNIEDSTFIKLLSEHLWANLSEDLLNNCISKTIPSSNVELQKFEQVENEIRILENYLCEIEFITKEQLLLSEYVKDIDKLYVNKICQDLLMKASCLMKKDLHDSFKYKPEKSIEYHEHLQKNSDDFNIEEKLSKNTFCLPSCQVSKSTTEILNLIKTILDEAIISREVCAAKLYYTSRNVLEQYMWTVPEYHKKFLETIPQQVALFHNNCMYLAHHLMMMMYKYQDKIPVHLQKYNITYVDLTLKLRSIGAQCFLDHLKHQKNIILDILKKSELAELGQQLSANTEKALRQCIRQLELLKTVWIDVLPDNVYSKALGCILNSMIQELILKVVTVEDISAVAAAELVNLFNMVVQRVPQILSEPDSINLYVKKWPKLLQLIKILEASLKDIEDGWANGKGPLALEFTASQLKQLIRALFQNTERRSALLASIK